MNTVFYFALLWAFAAPGGPPVGPVVPIANPADAAREQRTLAEWTVPSIGTVRAALDAWVGSFPTPPSREVRDRIDAVWTALPSTASVSGERLDAALRESMRLASSDAAAYLDACDTLEWGGHEFGRELESPPDPRGLERTSYLYGTLRLHRARALLRTHFLDESLAALEELTPQNTVDPVAALLAKAVVCNRLLRVDEAAESLKRFRAASETDADVPRRYSEIAKLIEADIRKREKEKEDDLQSIARQMDDVKRRLGAGRTGEKTQESEKDVLKALDETIEKIERRMKECEGGDQGRQSNNPAKDSKILRQKGPGEVHEKDLGDASGWGDLPPKEREEALLRMEKEFPSHYRAIIESYFREMAQSKESE